MLTVPEMRHRTNPVPRSRPDSSECHTCEVLLQKVNQARLHALLATAWAQLRAKQPTALIQAKAADSSLDGAFRELESHWRESHGMNC